MTKLNINSETLPTVDEADENVDLAKTATGDNDHQIANILRNTYSSVQELGPAFIVATEGDPVLVYKNATKNQWDVFPFRLTGKQSVLKEDGTF